MASGNTPSPFGFTGELQSQGLVYLRARWYDASGGTFTSRDPFAGINTIPNTLHPYMYAADNPVLYTDPSGKTWYISSRKDGTSDKSPVDLLTSRLTTLSNNFDSSALKTGATGGATVGLLIYLKYLTADAGALAFAAFARVVAIPTVVACIASSYGMGEQKVVINELINKIESNTGSNNGIAIATDGNGGMFFMSRDVQPNQQGQAKFEYWRPHLLGQFTIVNQLPPSMKLGFNPPVSIGEPQWWEGAHFIEDHVFAPNP